MSRRLVVLGRKKAKFHTVTMKIDNRLGENETVLAESLLPWFPKPAPGPNPGVDPDYDLLRKQQIEDAIARGDDL